MMNETPDSRHTKGHQRLATRYSLLAAALLAGACTSLPSPRLPVADSGPTEPVDVSHIPDAVPRAEPRSRYGNPDSYVVMGRRYHVLASSKGYVERGIASWYGTKFHGRRTSSGEPYDMYAMTAAHKTLPLPTYARVTNLSNGRTVVVRINDRGPFHGNRIIDLSYAAAVKLGIAGKGTGLVEVRALDPGRPDPSEPTLHQAGTPRASEPALYLQVGAFANRLNAERLSERLRRLNTPVEVTPATRRERTVYRVRIGPLAGAEEADRVASQLAEQGLVDTRVVID